jgi:hypothetical protein
MRRLYLDLADLLDIGDRRLPSKTVAELVAVAGASNAALVVSREHVQDASRGGASTVESLVCAVERFRTVVVVMDGPDSVEPLTPERGDICLQACANFRELALSDAAKGPLARMNDAYDRLHDGVQVAHRIASTAPMPPLRTRMAGALFSQAFVTLCHAWMGDDPSAIVSYWEGRLGAEINVEEREGIVARLAAFRGALPAFLALAADNKVDVTETLRLSAIWSTERAQWPGRFLALQIGAARRRDVQRKPKRSDWLDEEHAAHFPYVDIATCDANTRSIASRVLQTMLCPRPPELVPSGHLGLVVERLRRRERALGSPIEPMP